MKSEFGLRSFLYSTELCLGFQPRGLGARPGKRRFAFREFDTASQLVEAAPDYAALPVEVQISAEAVEEAAG